MMLHSYKKNVHNFGVYLFKFSFCHHNFIIFTFFNYFLLNFIYILFSINLIVDFHSNTESKLHNIKKTKNILSLRLVGNWIRMLFCEWDVCIRFGWVWKSFKRCCYKTDSIAEVAAVLEVVDKNTVVAECSCRTMEKINKN